MSAPSSVSEREPSSSRAPLVGPWADLLLASAWHVLDRRDEIKNHRKKAILDFVVPELSDELARVVHLHRPVQ